MVRIGMFLGDRYEILEKIGTGGMAEVFKGKDHKLNRFVAVKVLKDEFAEDKNFVRKFKEEAQAAAALAHPNIVNVYDVGDEMNINYIVMELVEGITLKTYIEKKGRLTVKEATSIAIQVASGLEVAHNNRIVHRDIKPQNIIISREGKVKVTDFGIAKSISSHTNTADSMGSVHYTSPEQARGGYSDAGRVPFDGETTVVVAVKHLQEDIVSPRVYASDVPISLEHIILKCTEKSPDRRYQNVTELIADLKQSLLTPDVNFVKEIVPDGAKTVAITRDEISKIKKETGRLPKTEEDAESHYAYLDRMNEENAADDEDEDSGDYDDADYDDEDYDDDDYEDYDEDEDEDDDDGGILDPKLEKIMMIGGIAAAVIIVIIVIVILTQVFGGGGSKKNNDDQNLPEIEDVEEEKAEVPNLLGKSYSEAKEELNSMNLGIKLGETRSSDEYDPGQIISQSVEAGTEVEANTTIVVDICGDGSQSEVPDLEGKSRTQAENALTSLGLSVDFIEEFSDTVDEGYVISTSPKAGSKVEKGGIVQVVVSKGSKEDAMVEVPTLTNRDESTAKQLLSSAGLASGSVTQEFSSSVESGKIISQNPTAGTKVEKGTKVSYVVSKGAEDVYIGVDASPGNSEQSVKSYLEGKGLVVNIIRENNDNYDKGIVFNVQPGNGSTVKPGSTVNVYVSDGPKPVEKVSIPSLKGMDTATAANTLSASGFSLGTVSKGSMASRPEDNGKIYAQSAEGEVNKGSVTTINVTIYSDHVHTEQTNSDGSVTCSSCGAVIKEASEPTEPSGGTDTGSGSGSGQSTT